ncbi:hypothetical protein PPERSA_01600 [Pseudocohnilembus persalinus]|uniref:AMP-dependent synthetase/ligase domain-containing protein n=1 Tax=Pseudocohnilembus persalinus TaxID=266149 RepID=A0A0V0QHQ8_PSEPJ|nr:hypothetical protein PPERSA_01600 [Pseudocohnilembus persalinus]|eukprot:KRX01730.1 hypothetical protein PPERSA_01600 [Pseudocohnilembus persalinus]
MIDWKQQPRTILDQQNPDPGFWRWFNDGWMNITYNALDRWAKVQPDAVAINYYSAYTGTSKKFTYDEVLDIVSRLAQALKEQGVEKGDRVIIYMPLVPQALFSMLAVARIGAIHSVVFGGFAANELANRIIDCKPKLIISCSCGIEPNNKVIPYKELLDQAIQLSRYYGKCIIFQRKTLKTESMKYGRDFDFYELLKHTKEKADAVAVRGSDPHYILYTSGSTGKPKGIVRDQVGTSLGSLFSMKYIFNVGKGETYFAASDIGWVVGHTFICYAPLLVGGQSVLYEGKPVGTPDASIYWKLIEKYRVKTLFTAPTAVRAIRKEDPQGEFIKKYDISSLELFSIAGERLDINTGKWIQERLPGKKIMDNYWQTETGWPMSSNFANLHWFDDIKFGSAGKPVPGYDIQIMDDNNQIIKEPNTLGKIVCKLPMPPSFMQTVWNNDNMYIEKYLKEVPGYYLVGDSGIFDENGNLSIMTRIDDVINTAGHRLSTGQLEETILNHNQIVEAAVVAMNDELKGQIPVGFVVAKNSDIDNLQIEKELIQLVRNQIGPVAAFKYCILVKRLPKTRSGKILRHILQKMINGIKIDQIPATIEDPVVLDEIKESLEIYKSFKATSELQ